MSLFPQFHRMIQEQCQSPFKKRLKEHKNDIDIAVYIFKDGVMYPICRTCWDAIGSSDLEWQA